MGDQAEEEPSKRRSPKILILHRFDKGRIEDFVSQKLIPSLSQRIICLRIQQAGNTPGEPGYWLQIFQLLSGLVDGIITVEVASEAYSDNIFFEQSIVPRLTKGMTSRAGHFAGHKVHGALADQLLKVPVLTLFVDGMGLGDFVFFHEAGRRFVRVEFDNVGDIAGHTRVREALDEFAITVQSRDVQYSSAFNAAWLNEQLYFIALVRHPIVFPAIDLRFKDDSLRVNLKSFPRTKWDEVADSMLHNSEVLAGWSEMDSLRKRGGQSSEGLVAKIAGVQARKWGWITDGDPSSRGRFRIFNMIIKITTRVQLARLRIRMLMR